jgi:hypothetical protein
VRLPRPPIGSEAFPGLSNHGSTLEGVPPSPPVGGSIPTSKVLEMSWVCTCSAQSVLSGGIEDDFVGVKIEKKFFGGNSALSLSLVSLSNERAIRLVGYSI